MLSKQLASRIKEEKDRENQLDPSLLNITQCDRLLRAVSCKHDTNHAIRKANINVLQSFDNIKLYMSPKLKGLISHNLEEVTQTGLTNSSKLPRRYQSINPDTTPNDSLETNETNLKEILDQIVDNINTTDVSKWFLLPQTEDQPSLFELIQNSLVTIDYNLKRNSDFINELTKLLDTSRELKQEAFLKNVLKSLEEERNDVCLSKPPTCISQPASPVLAQANPSDTIESKKKLKSRSFRGFSSFTSLKSKQATSQTSIPTMQTESTNTNQNPTLSSIAIEKHQLKDSTVVSSLINSESINSSQLNSNHGINNSDYTKLEHQVEKISYNLDDLLRKWSKLAHCDTTEDQFKSMIEFQTLINNLNSTVTLKELDQSLFKLNWLITSKSGQAEPNWKTSVLALTPSTFDSFIGVNLLKNYYRYVKFDFVSYKLFTKQLQLIQISAILLVLIHQILNFYKESTTLSSITNTLNSMNTVNGQNSNLINDSSSALCFSFSGDKYRPISWSANHVTLYNLQSFKNPLENSTDTKFPRPRNLSRTSSKSRADYEQPTLRKEEHIRLIKKEIFLNEIKEFLNLSVERLNIQANLTNRTGYFYIVNQSTGLVLQAVDFTSDQSLKDQIELNQKRIKNSSIKGRVDSKPLKSLITKGPRFYLMPKFEKVIKENSKNSPHEISNDEQLWYYYLINGCVANKTIRSGHCMAASSLNPKSPVTFWTNVRTTNCSWFFNHQDKTIVSGLSDNLVLDYVIVDEVPNQRYAVVIDTKVPNKASQKWSFEFF